MKSKEKSEIKKLQTKAEKEAERLKGIGWKQKDFTKALKNLLEGS